MNRFNGQIWIDKNSPNRLKYYVNGNEYEVVVSQNYAAASVEGGIEEIPTGSVVALTADGTISKAHFPNDIDKVIGIAGPAVGGSYPIITSGTLIVDKSVFYDSIDKSVDFNKFIGCPVYWFIGRTEYVEKTHSYVTIDCCNNHCGKLTVGTPSGVQWGKTEIADPSFNVGYDNLPTVGVISGVEDGKIYISVNFTGFDNTLGWSWPLFGDGSISKDGNTVNIAIRHGLFHLNRNCDLKPRCFCDIIALDADNDTEYQVAAAVDNYYEINEIEAGITDRRTEIVIKTLDDYRYTVHGTVVYNLGKTAAGESK